MSRRGDDAIVLAGDLNFRRDAQGTDQLQALLAASGRWSCIAGMHGWHEAGPLYFSPTCKLCECRSTTAVSGDSEQNNKCLLCRSQTTNVPAVCYHSDTSQGKRIPSHCDRVLIHGKTLRAWRYDAFVGAPSVKLSDHNAVVADLDWLPLQHHQQLQRFALRQRPLRLRVYYIRHALSCTNVLGDFGRTLLDQTVRRYAHRDPLLTDRGVEQAHQRAFAWQSKQLPQPDVVVTSALRRAIETAHYMFPDYVGLLVQAPYIAERYSIPENTPLPVQRQCATFGPALRRAVDYRFVLDCEAARGESDCERFEEWLALHLPYILADDVLTSGRTINVAIVTHSLHMLKCLQLNNIPANTAVLCLAYMLDGKKLRRIDDSGFSCSLNSLPGAAPVTALNERDVARCQSGDFVKRLKFSDAA